MILLDGIRLSSTSHPALLCSFYSCLFIKVVICFYVKVIFFKILLHCPFVSVYFVKDRCLHEVLHETSTRQIPLKTYFSSWGNFQSTKLKCFILWCTVCVCMCWVCIWYHTCLLISAPVWSSHNKHSGWPPNAAMWVGVCANLEVTVFTPQPTWTRRITHSNCGETRAWRD